MADQVLVPLDQTQYSPVAPDHHVYAREVFGAVDFVHDTGTTEASLSWLRTIARL